MWRMRTLWRHYRRPITQEELKVQRNLSVLLVVVLLAVVTVLTFRDLNLWAAEDEDAARRGLRLLVDASGLVRTYYVNEVNDKKLFEDAVQGMLQGLDRFSGFVPEEHLPEFNKHIQGTFGGVGIEIGMPGNRLTVISPIEDGPAFRAGVMAGDQIISIEGESTEDMTMDQAVKILTGKPGTKVKFTVIHEADRKRETFTISREEIHIKTVKGIDRDAEGNWKYIVDEGHGVAYIRLTSFTGDTVADLRKAVEEAGKQGMKNLVLDLRWNGGGMLDAAVGVADIFLEKGVIVSTRGRSDPEEKHEAKPGNAVTDVPMVVLANAHSASASEIVAGALQDHQRAIVLGERTFGKGSVQRILYLQDGKCAIKLTVAKYYLPSGRCIHREKDSEVWGVDPLIEVKMSLEEAGAVFQARRGSEILRVNGKAINGKTPDGEAEPHEVAPPADDGEDPGDGAGATEDGETQGDGKPDPIKMDRQLSTAIDVLKILPLVRQFSDLQTARDTAQRPAPLPLEEPTNAR